MTYKSVFRYHDEMPTRITTHIKTSALFRQLIEEWVRLNSSTAASNSVQAWAQTEPILMGHQRPCDIVDAVDAAPNDQQDAIMLALLRLTHTGQSLAGRILLQLMLHKLGQMSLKLTARDSDTHWDEDRKQLVVAEFWDVVATYPIERRPNSVAANLALDTLHRCTKNQPWRGREIPTSSDTLTEQYEQSNPTPDTPTEVADLIQPGRLAGILEWAVRSAIITNNDKDLILAVYVAGEEPQHAAHRLNVTAAVIRKRCSRARQRLTNALAEQPLHALELAS